MSEHHSRDRESVERDVTTDNGHYVELNEKAIEYVRDCQTEKHRLDSTFPICERLLDQEMEKVYNNGRVITKEYFANVYREKPLRVVQKVYVPVHEHPKFNFVGKILGPKGNTLRRLQEETCCKMVILGKGSMRDRLKEEELRSLNDPKYGHLNKELHIEVSTIAPPSEAYARIAYALTEVRKYLIPDMNDEIRQEQLREISDGKHRKPPHPHRGQPPPPPSHYNSTSKVFSILEKARSAMDSSYPYEYDYDYDYYYHHYPPHYPPPPPHITPPPPRLGYEYSEYRRRGSPDEYKSPMPKKSSAGYRPAPYSKPKM